MLMQGIDQNNDGNIDFYEFEDLYISIKNTVNIDNSVGRIIFDFIY